MTGVAHVWVRETNGPRHWPGLVMNWVQDDNGTWSAQVIYRRDSPEQFITEWITRDRLTPVPWRPDMGTRYG